MTLLADLPGPPAEPVSLGVGTGWIISPAARPRFSVVFFPHRTGVDEFVVDVSGWLLRRGFLVLIADPLARLPDELTPEQRKRLLVDAELIDMAVRAVAEIRDRAPALGAPGALGFCLGGRVAFLAAAAQTGIARAACFYGGEIETGWHDPASPVSRIRPGTPPVQLHRGTRDSNATAAAQQAAQTAADATGGYLETCTYSGARHAFANRFAAERYHPDAARRAFASMRAFLTDDALAAPSAPGRVSQ